MKAIRCYFKLIFTVGRAKSIAGRQDSRQTMSVFMVEVQVYSNQPILAVLI